MSVMADEASLVLFPLFVDYGQLASAREWTACQLLHARHCLPKVARMKISGFGKVITSGITSKAMRINEDAFLPGRNLLLLLCGAAYAYKVRADSVAIGLLNQEDRLFPDQSKEFLKRSEDVIDTTMGKHIAVLAPLIEFTKADVLAMAEARGLADTYSCHAGGDMPCGKCVSCKEITHAKERR
jgi:7-cyano-7-deazaguanine synthase